MLLYCTVLPTTALRDPSSKCTLHLPVVFNTPRQNFIVMGYTLKTSVALSLSKPEFRLTSLSAARTREERYKGSTVYSKKEWTSVFWGSHGGEYEDACLLRSCAVYSGRSLLLASARLWLVALMMEAASISETSVNFDQATCRNNIGDSHIYGQMFLKPLKLKLNKIIFKNWVRT
jgi:hypothetical protein